MLLHCLPITGWGRVNSSTVVVTPLQNGPYTMYVWPVIRPTLAMQAILSSRWTSDISLSMRSRVGIHQWCVRHFGFPVDLDVFDEGGEWGDWEGGIHDCLEGDSFRTAAAFVGVQLRMRSQSDSELTPAKTTECTAPMRAQARVPDCHVMSK